MPGYSIIDDLMALNCSVQLTNMGEEAFLTAAEALRKKIREESVALEFCELQLAALVRTVRKKFKPAEIAVPENLLP